MILTAEGVQADADPSVNSPDTAECGESVAGEPSSMGRIPVSDRVGRTSSPSPSANPVGDRGRQEIGLLHGQLIHVGPMRRGAK